MSGAVHLEDLGAGFVVDADQEGGDGERPHAGALRIDLGNVGDAAGQLGDRDG